MSQLNLDGIKVEIEKIFSNNLINIENENAILFLNETLQDMVFFQSFYFDGEKLYNWIREDENDFKYLDINKIIDFINSVEIENYSTYMQKNIDNYHKLKDILYLIYDKNYDNIELFPSFKWYEILKDDFLLFNVSLFALFVSAFFDNSFLFGCFLSILCFSIFYILININKKFSKPIKHIKISLIY